MPLIFHFLPPPSGKSDYRIVAQYLTFNNPISSAGQIESEKEKSMHSALRIDFRRVDLIHLRSVGVRQTDIGDLFHLPNSQVYEYPDHTYLIGYLPTGKMLHAAFVFHENVNFDIDLLQADIPYEDDVKKYWCKRK